MNKEAGRGGHLTVKLRLESGDALPFDVDTGAPVTVLNTSLEPQLGKRLGQSSLNWWNGKEISHIYTAPKLYLGNIRLPIAAKIFTSDLTRMGSNTMGVLGMDCLQHYCIQLDFEAGKMRFLDPDHLRVSELGRAFSLTFSGIDPERTLIRPTIHHEGLIANNTNLLIDTGCNIDGMASEGEIKGTAVFLPECVWDCNTFTNLLIAAADHYNTLGLSFLARHLVTLDFPNRMMYLKQTRTGPLAGDILNEITLSNHRTTLEAYESLKEKNQLPSLSKNDKGAVYFEANSDPGSESVMFGVQQNGDSSTCHYTVSRTSEESPWKLQKAWRTDQNGQTIEEYPVP
ncbi:MAG TPA: aspartyl protease family protein [Verrucomicrobiae bacterium]|nr:aspartyl protease family protein [Verrucomicrobiae bacterium]